ncbi:HIT domain-containing protein [Indioceanicola profundi]|uniref:HIT domain-containing protein n=1 Tax=Indioceanicola profundi TaxID=2220096 RepID=UPI000E6A9505|nr:HIT family protein [Indioceanicola profundi]
MTSQSNNVPNDQNGTSFALHPRLAADTLFVADLALCRVLLMHNAAFPWLILVPRRVAATEIHHLPAADRFRLMEEMALAAQALERLAAPDKMNVGALGNVVPQLHVHVVARRRDDPAWPGPVWGSGVHRDYGAGEAEAFAMRISEALAAPA